MERKKKAWLHGAVGYEIYTRSFQDTTGNGFGDLRGITQRLDHLAWLGVDIVWLTPIYPSPDHDHGYDVADYRAVRPEHGDIEDVKALLDRAHELGLKVLLDIVPNHSSSEHRWFQKAISDPSSPERDMYLWRDPAPDGGPPNNWLSHFGGPAWTLDEASGQYYCHLFLPEQPDLDWRHDAVLGEFDDIYRFWFELGVDGFRIDVAHGLLKHPSFSDNPRTSTPGPDAGPLERFFAFDHLYDMDQDENVEIFARWQAIADEYDATLLAESGVEDHERLARYVGPDALDLSFFLKPGWMDWDPEKIIREHLGLAEIEPDGISWIICNHDQPRVASRYSKGGLPLEVGQMRALAVTTLHMALGGVPFIYYGEELGLASAEIDPAGREDPIATRNDTEGGEARDVARTQMPWDSSPQNGFSTAAPWIISPDRSSAETVEAQRADPNAIVHRYRKLLQVRKENPDLFDATFERLDAPADGVGIVRRGSTLTVANLTDSEQHIELPDGTWHCEFISNGPTPVDATDSITLGPERSAILRRV